MPPRRPVGTAGGREALFPTPSTTPHAPGSSTEETNGARGNAPPPSPAGPPPPATPTAPPPVPPAGQRPDQPARGPAVGDQHQRPLGRGQPVGDRGEHPGRHLGRPLRAGDVDPEAAGPAEVLRGIAVLDLGRSEALPGA